jgi:hypothetical protein
VPTFPSAAAAIDGLEVKGTGWLDYEHAFTYDILPGSSTGSYFAGGIQLASTLMR